MSVTQSEREWIDQQVSLAPPFNVQQRRRLSRLLWTLNGAVVGPQPAFIDDFSRIVDPDGTLEPEERLRRAANAKAATARRLAAERAAEIAEAEAPKAGRKPGGKPAYRDPTGEAAVRNIASESGDPHRPLRVARAKSRPSEPRYVADMVDALGDALRAIR